LERALRRVQLLRDEIDQYYWDFLVTGDLLELRNLATCAELVIKCALARKESRGGHSRTDFPDYSKDFSRVNHITKFSGGSMKVEAAAIEAMPKELEEIFDAAVFKKLLGEEA
jgi:aspartate oxidase